MGRTWAQKLNHLLETVRPEGREDRFTVAEIAAGTGLSASYIRNLLRGSQDKPSFENAEALARFFGVNVAYFSGDDEVADRIDEQLALLKRMAELNRALQRADVERLAARMLNLSAPGVAAISQMVEVLLDREQATDRNSDPKGM